MFCVWKCCLKRILGPLIVFVALVKVVSYALREKNRKNGKKTIGFFHPYCDAGGGGERVLWVLVDALLSDPTMKEHLHIVIYSGENKDAETIFNNVEGKFGICFSPEQRHQDITFVNIQSRSLLEAKWYPVLTMLGQSLGSVIVGLECFYRSGLTSSSPAVPLPDVFCDTTGAAFTYIAAKMLFNCVVVPYVHYPTISTDMLQKVREMRPTYNNNAAITNSATMSWMKLAYYHTFAFFYATVLNTMTDLLIANGSWTEGHLMHLLDAGNSVNGRSIAGGKIKKVFPPCNTAALVKSPTVDTRTEPEYVVVSAPKYRKIKLQECVFVSIGQFRPEKDHLLQINAFHHFLRTHPELRSVPGLKLVIVGSVRNAGDEAVAEGCRQEIARLDKSEELSEEERAEVRFSERVELRVNVPYKDLVRCIHEEASVGVHSMWNEHFGISVVEMLAAGLVTIAHASGGPLQDIITCPARGTETESELPLNCNGFLAATKEEYASCMAAAVGLFQRRTETPKPEVLSLGRLIENAQESVITRFSDEAFKQEMCGHFSRFIVG